MIRERSLPSVDWLCGFFQKSRQAYYQMRWRKDREGVDCELIINYVKEYRREMKKVGTRKLHYLLQKQLEVSGIKCGRDKLFSLLGREGLLIRRKRARIHTTCSQPVAKFFPNLVKDITINDPELVWASDTTALAVRDGLGYLTLTTDVYSKQIMGYNVQRTKQSSGSLMTLRMALSRRRYPERQLIHHSDGGGEYFNHVYLQELVKAHVKVSCTAPSSPQENAVAERINGILKEEFLLVEDHRSFEDILKKLPEVIRIYNERRPHASIDYKTPIEAHGCSGPLRKRWNTYRKQNKKTKGLIPAGQQIQQLMSSWK
jgi:transposase InsO family protein